MMKNVKEKLRQEHFRAYSHCQGIRGRGRRRWRVLQGAAGPWRSARQVLPRHHPRTATHQTPALSRRSKVTMAGTTEGTILFFFVLGHEGGKAVCCRPWWTRHLLLSPIVFCLFSTYHNHPRPFSLLLYLLICRFYPPPPLKSSMSSLHPTLSRLRLLPHPPSSPPPVFFLHLLHGPSQPSLRRRHHLSITLIGWDR